MQTQSKMVIWYRKADFNVIFKICNLMNRIRTKVVYKNVS